MTKKDLVLKLKGFVEEEQWGVEDYTELLQQVKSNEQFSSFLTEIIKDERDHIKMLQCMIEKIKKPEKIKCS